MLGLFASHRDGCLGCSLEARRQCRKPVARLHNIRGHVLYALRTFGKLAKAFQNRHRFWVTINERFHTPNTVKVIPALTPW